MRFRSFPFQLLLKQTVDDILMGFNSHTILICRNASVFLAMKNMHTHTCQYEAVVWSLDLMELLCMSVMIVFVSVNGDIQNF